MVRKLNAVFGFHVRRQGVKPGNALLARQTFAEVSEELRRKRSDESIRIGHFAEIEKIAWTQRFVGFRPVRIQVMVGDVF